MKEFKDLLFETHPIGNGLQAIMFFENGYGVSVVRFKSLSGGYGSYTSNDKEWELAVLHGNDKEFTLVYDTPVTNDVIGHLDSNGVTEIMSRVQKLKKQG